MVVREGELHLHDGHGVVVEHSPEERRVGRGGEEGDGGEAAAAEEVSEVDERDGVPPGHEREDGDVGELRAMTTSSTTR
jgi:hypothetical protein